MDDFLNIDPNEPLYKYCRNATNREDDTFVGIKSEHIENKTIISIHFPLGYKISQDDEVLRDEIIQLMSVLNEYNDQQSVIDEIQPDQLLKTVSFPVQAYLTVILDYLNNGYYQIKEDMYVQGTSGAISWSQTIKKEDPIAMKSGFIYQKYRVKHHSETDKDLINEISKYCVYQSMLRLGWVYKLPLPPKPVMTRELPIYGQYLDGMIYKTNKDEEKRIFKAMSRILNFENTNNDSSEFYFGTNRFEYIWERLIQATYGNKDKEYYFPKTKWLLSFGRDRANAALEPDTVMGEGDDLYILDAKYYKYGETRIPSDLPDSSSINKQISYGENVAVNDKFKAERDAGMEIYNAFLMPYNAEQEIYSQITDNYFSVGEAVADWKQSTESYQRVQGILVDIKFLIGNNCKPNQSEITKLAEAIKKSIENNNTRNTKGQGN